MADGSGLIFLGDAGASVCLVQAVDAHDEALLPAEYARIRAQAAMPVALAAFRTADWNRDLSPWAADAVFGKAGFAGGAEETLKYLLHTFLPQAKEALSLPDCVRFILGGYSLAGLFALWACCRTDAFSACAAASPSVWFPGWIDYAQTHPLRCERVYLSLGDKEPKTRNSVMARVGDCIRRQEALLSEIPHTLEWNEGNHFREPEVRTAKAFAWCLQG